jgi:chemosensory pili system protein ChpC
MSYTFEAPAEIRGVLIPLQSHTLLLPNAAVTEIIDYRELDPVDDAPAWLAGTTNWHRRRLPVVQFERLLGESEIVSGQRRKIMVCYTLNETAREPFIGILAKAIPRLVRVTPEQLQGRPLPSEMADSPVTAALSLGDQAALIPDLERLESRLTQA